LKAVPHKYIGASILAALLCSMSASVWALGDQWYIGAGGGISLLNPVAEDVMLDVEEKNGTAATLFLGVDLDETSSAQLQLHSLGDAEFTDGELASYLAGDVSVLYRFVDSRDFAPRGRVFGASLYGRFGLGFIDRDSEIDLDRGAPIFFGAGAGLEIYLTHNLALRAEGIYMESDASSFGISLVGRFGGRGPRQALPPQTSIRPEPAPSTQTLAETADAEVDVDADVIADASSDDGISTPDELSSDALELETSDSAQELLPETYIPPTNQSAPSGLDATQSTATGSINESTTIAEPSPIAAESASLRPPSINPNEQINPRPNPISSITQDADVDGIPDEFDDCPNSLEAYPVLDNGCPQLEGVLSGIQFVENTAELLPGADDQLNFLADVLAQYPEARIELKAHTDNSRDQREQSILTRARLRTIGTYLVIERGVRARRLVLRSLGGAKPIADNNTEAGRLENNRIEISENPR